MDKTEVSFEEAIACVGNMGLIISRDQYGDEFRWVIYDPHSDDRWEDKPTLREALENLLMGVIIRE